MPAHIRIQRVIRGAVLCNHVNSLLHSRLKPPSTGLRLMKPKPLRVSLMFDLFYFTDFNRGM